MAQVQCPALPTSPVINSSETPPLSKGPPGVVHTHLPALAQHLRAKRLYKLTSEGRDPWEDRKRTKMPSTIPVSRKASRRFASRTTSLRLGPIIKPFHMTTDRMQKISLESRNRSASVVPSATPTKLLFPPPDLRLRTTTKKTSRRPVTLSRRSSYERRHAGPHFKIYGDSTATNRLFLISSSYPIFPLGLTPARPRLGTDTAEQDQENDLEQRHEISTPDFTDREHAPRPAATFAGDTTTGAPRSAKGVIEVSKQALKVLRMMR